MFSNMLWSQSNATEKESQVIASDTDDHYNLIPKPSPSFLPLKLHEILALKRFEEPDQYATLAPWGQ